MHTLVFLSAGAVMNTWTDRPVTRPHLPTSTTRTRKRPRREDDELRALDADVGADAHVAAVCVFGFAHRAAHGDVAALGE